MRLIAILHGRVCLSLGATGGIHTSEDAVKLLLAGATVVLVARSRDRLDETARVIAEMFASRLTNRRYSVAGTTPLRWSTRMTESSRMPFPLIAEPPLDHEPALELARQRLSAAALPPELESLLGDIEACGGLAVGSLTINGDAVKPVWDLLSSLALVNVRDKLGGAFGSYGWSGEAVGQVKEYLEAMKAKGFGGVLLFDADGSNHDGNRRTPAGPTFLSPAWRELFRHAVREAARVDMELSVNIQSGWNLGGPMVASERAAKIATGHELEREITGKARHRRENAGLDGRHGGSCRRRIQRILARGGARQPPHPRIRIMPDERVVHCRDNRHEDVSGP